MSVNLQNLENTETAQESFDDVIDRRKQRKERQLDAEDVRTTVEEGEDPDVAHVDVAGETIPMEPLGLGTRARITRDTVKADRQGDELGGLEAVLDMIDAMIDASPDAYDRKWWDDLQETQVRGAFRSLSQKSMGGNGQ